MAGPSLWVWPAWVQIKGVKPNSPCLFDSISYYLNSDYGILRISGKLRGRKEFKR